MGHKKDDEILISVEEHASNSLPWFEIAKLTGCKISYIELNEEGRIIPENVLKAITPKTKLISIAMVSNVMGYIVNVKEIAKIVDKPLGTVLWIYNKAMKDLKRKVEDDNEERS